MDDSIWLLEIDIVTVDLGVIIVSVERTSKIGNIVRIDYPHFLQW